VDSTTFLTCRQTTSSSQQQVIVSAINDYFRGKQCADGSVEIAYMCYISTLSAS
jgi:hypothetical protein